jgi:molybdate transport system permease protein
VTGTMSRAAEDVARPVATPADDEPGRRPPAFVVVPAAVGLAFLVLPAIGLMVRAPWRRLPHELTSSVVLDALRLSLVCATSATVCCLLLGVPLAWLLARSDIRGRSVLRAFVLVPLVLPPVVGGVALLLAFGRNGLVPLHIAFTTRAAIVAEAFVALPFLVLSVEGALLSLDREFEEVAATLGSRPVATFRRVTLPLMAPAVAAGAALAWARALGEFGATVTFAGSLPGRTQTLPIEVYQQLQIDPDAAVALSVVLLLISLLVLVALRGRWRVTR